MIVIIDYGLGNIRSVENAFKKAGAEVLVSASARDISAADAIVVPGVGAFGKAVSNLKNLKIFNLIADSIKNKKPYLGICLGFQLLFTASSEHGNTPGFNILPGKVQKIKGKVKVPHMGWNNVYCPKESLMFSGTKEKDFFYFDHSYYVLSTENSAAAGITEYGVKFISAVCRENIWGAQFHPEKSSDTGLKIIRSFTSYVS